MMPPVLGTGSHLDGLLPTSTSTAPRPPEADVKAARSLAARIAPATMEEFFSGVRTQTHTQLEALAFVLHEEYPNRITDQVKKEVAERLVALRQEVAQGSVNLPEGLSDTAKIEAELKRTENRLEWVRRLLTRPAPVTPVTPVQPPAPSFLTDFFGGLTTRVMTMFNGRPPTVQQVAAVQTQTSGITRNLAEAGERLVDSVIASPETLSRIPVIGSALAAPINIIGGLMGINPATRAERLERRQAERQLRTALTARNVVCPNPTIDSLTLSVLKGQPVVPGAPAPAPSTAPVNIIQLLDNWVATQRLNGMPVTQQLVLNSVAELAPPNVDALNKQAQAKRAVDARNALTDGIGKRLRRPVATLTNGTDVQMQATGAGIALTARIGDLNTPGAIPPLGTPANTPTTTPASTRDFDDTGTPVSPEAKTLAGAMIKFPRATKIRIVANGNTEMTNSNEYTIAVGSFDETGSAQNDTAKTLVGACTKFPTAKEVKITASGTMECNGTGANKKYTLIAGSIDDTGNGTSPEGTLFLSAIEGLSAATKIAVTTSATPLEIRNQTEFSIPVGSDTDIANLQILAGMPRDSRAQRIVIDGSMRRNVPLVEWRNSSLIHLGSHPQTIAMLRGRTWGSLLDDKEVGVTLQYNRDTRNWTDTNPTTRTPPLPI